MKVEMMLREQERARHRVPKAPPPPPVVEMMPEEALLDYEEDYESVVLDTGMHTVKVRVVKYFCGKSSILCIPYHRLV